MDVNCSTGCERVQVFGGEVLLLQAVLPEENTGMVPEKPGLAARTFNHAWTTLVSLPMLLTII